MKFSAQCLLLSVLILQHQVALVPCEITHTATDCANANRSSAVRQSVTAVRGSELNMSSTQTWAALLLSTKQAVAYLQVIQRSQRPHKRRYLARQLIDVEIAAQHWLAVRNDTGVRARQASGILTGMSAQSAAPEMRLSRPSSCSLKGLCTAFAGLSH